MSDGGETNGRRRFLTAMTSVVGAAGAVGAAYPFVSSWQPSAKAKAAGAPVKFNLAKLLPGEQTTVEWRGKPVYVVRRTPEAISALEKLSDRVSDPESKEEQQPSYVDTQKRSIKDEFLIVVGICTHLGCAPKYHPEVGATAFDGDWLGGFFCPCHGSKFDLAGRVFKGVPAPLNLEVPPHRYVSDEVVIIGEDEEVA